MDPTNQNEGLGSYVAGGDSSNLSGPQGGSPTQDDRTMGMLAHVGAALGYIIGLPFLAPLLLLLTKGKDSSFIRYHSVESLNLLIMVLIVSVLTCGFGSILAVPVAAVLNIIAGLKANEGELYRYPIPMPRFIK